MRVALKVQVKFLIDASYEQAYSTGCKQRRTNRFQLTVLLIMYHLLYYTCVSYAFTSCNLYSLFTESTRFANLYSPLATFLPATLWNPITHHVPSLLLLLLVSHGSSYKSCWHTSCFEWPTFVPFVFASAARLGCTSQLEQATDFWIGPLLLVCYPCCWENVERDGI